MANSIRQLHAEACRADALSRQQEQMLVAMQLVGLAQRASGANLTCAGAGGALGELLSWLKTLDL